MHQGVDIANRGRVSLEVCIICLNAEVENKGIQPGIFELLVAYTYVTEVSSRYALHCHGIGCTTASSDFLASIAVNEDVWSECTEALMSQIVGKSWP